MNRFALRKFGDSVIEKKIVEGHILFPNDLKIEWIGSDEGCPMITFGEDFEVKKIERGVIDIGRKGGV